MGIILGVRAHDYGRDSANGLFKRISGDGWECVQLAFKKAIAGVEQYTDITDSVIKETAKSLVTNKISVGVLGCYIEPSLADEAQRKVQVAEFIAGLAVAKSVGAVCIGTETTNVAKQPGVTREQALAQLRKSLCEIMPEAERLGVTVAIEPVFYHALATPELARDMLKDIASPNLKIIYDPVNILSYAEEKTQQDLWKRAMDCFGDKVVAVHMKGVYFDGERPVACPFAKSVADYETLSGHILELSRQRDIPVLREEVKPDNAQEDLAFLKGLYRRG